MIIRDNNIRENGVGRMIGNEKKGMGGGSVKPINSMEFAMILNAFSPFFSTYSPFQEEVLNRGLGISLWKTRKISFFLEKIIFYGFSMELNVFLAFFDRIHAS